MCGLGHEWMRTDDEAITAQQFNYGEPSHVLSSAFVCSQLADYALIVVFKKHKHTPSQSDL